MTPVTTTHVDCSVTPRLDRGIPLGQKDVSLNIRISDDVVFRDLSGEAVILNLSSGVYFGLDEIGTRMWHLLAEYGDEEKVIKVLLMEYEVQERQLRQDVQDLIHELMDRRLLESDGS